MTAWLSSTEIAEANGVTTTRVLVALRLIGLHASARESRLEAGVRVYSPGAVALVLREIRSRDTDIGDDGQLPGGVMVTETMAVLKIDDVEFVPMPPPIIWEPSVPAQVEATIKLTPDQVKADAPQPMTVEALRERVKHASGLRLLTIEIPRSSKPKHGKTMRLPLRDGDRLPRWGPNSAQDRPVTRVSAGIYSGQWLVSDLRTWLETSSKGQKT